jgi:uncharacterized protein (DUF924 family)
MEDLACIESILDYWFGDLDNHGMCPQAQHALWFQSRPVTDREISDRFGANIVRALDGELDHWYESDAGAIALLLLLDQFTRNTGRGTTRAFAGDPAALTLAKRMVQEGRDRKMPTIYRVFVYIPFEHAENLEAQEEGIALLAQLAGQCDPGVQSAIENFHRYACAHRDVIARFGRFPHRNAILKRQSTAQELEHLAQHGGF